LFPIAYQVSYIDLEGALGYGFQWKKRWLFGANLKVVNRRFSTERIPVTDYDDRLNAAMDVLKSDVIGVTGDFGCAYQNTWGTNFGLSLQNIFPIQSVKENIELNYRTPKIYYDRTPTGQPVTNAAGDTALVSAYQKITINRSFELKSPFIANIGISHPITKDWDIAVDWVDMFEQDSRYNTTWERIQLGSEYRLNFWKKNFQLGLRGGVADEKFCCGLGVNFSKLMQRMLMIAL